MLSVIRLVRCYLHLISTDYFRTESREWQSKNGVTLHNETLLSPITDFVVSLIVAIVRVTDIFTDM